ncbi:DNA-binding protein [Apibacter sp. HY039]|uniref:DNA-binding protein n=1 Tax=Apibacter sp. HY039 TaxID=2501476 RepID=UPI000FEC0F69|nr:DNA-binding protein [Apibacter sp. HY039]
MNQQKVIKWAIREIGKLKIEIKLLKEGIQGNPNKELKEYLTKKEASLEFNISERTIDRWRQEGLEVIQIKRNAKVLFCRKNIEKFLKYKS